MALRCITHNVMIVYVWGGFLQGIPDTFSLPRLWIITPCPNYPIPNSAFACSFDI